MKNLTVFLLLLTILVTFSCSEEEATPTNYIKITIDDSNYTFIGGSILEPTTLLKDTLQNTISLGGFIGDCFEGSREFIDIQINHTEEGTYNLSDGIQFWMETETHSIFTNERSTSDQLILTISELEETNGLISGSFSGSVGVSFSGVFSLRRLPDYTVTFVVAKELCNQ